MKKKIAVLAISALVIFTGCASKDAVENKDTNTNTNTETTTEATQSTDGYKDGTYTLESDKTEYGYEKVVVTIAEGKISEVQLDRLDGKGNVVDYELFNGEEKDGKKWPDLKGAREDLSKQIIEAQSADGVDAISGATDSTSKWLTLTKEILSNQAAK